VLTVHHLGISQSERIVWLCEELEIPFRLMRLPRHTNGASGVQSAPSLRDSACDHGRRLGPGGIRRDHRVCHRKVRWRPLAREVGRPRLCRLSVLVPFC
jgi:hypothetical protein